MSAVGGRWRGDWSLWCVLSLPATHPESGPTHLTAVSDTCWVRPNPANQVCTSTRLVQRSAGARRSSMNAGVVEYVKWPERRASVPCSACGAGGRGVRQGSLQSRAACRAEGGAAVW
jgi:hypothetical protein